MARSRALATNRQLLESVLAHATALRVGAALLALLAVVGAGFLRGLGVGLLTLAAFLLLGVIALIWSSVQSLTGESPLSLDEALGMAAPRAEEEQKRAVLRALKDLEYERSVGKISEEDYAELSARYRQQAKALLRSLDENLSGARERAEALLEQRLHVAAPVAPSGKKKKRKAKVEQPIVEAPDSEEPEDSEDSSDEPERSARRCAECDVQNELDARFCKGCGKPMTTDPERSEA